MEFTLWILFAAAILVASVSPGPNVLIVVVNALKFGHTGALWTIFGNLLCLFCVALLASIGVGAAIATAPLAYTIMKVAGGLYLAWLGFKMIRSSLGKMTEIQVEQAAKSGRPVPHFTLMSEAFLVSASNPKSILFLSAIFPQFLRPESPVIPQFAVMFATIIVIVFIIHGLYGLFAMSFRDKPVSVRARAWIARITGGTFIGLGAGVALAK
ncbi:MAG: LysE family translocator [Pseudomonadota bacterium]